MLLLSYYESYGLKDHFYSDRSNRAMPTLRVLLSQIEIGEPGQSASDRIAQMQSEAGLTVDE